VLLGAGIFFVFLFAIAAVMIVAVSGSHGGEFGGFGDKIAVVDLEGVIIEPQTVVKELKEFADDDSVKAIIIHINTPGGGAAVSRCFRGPTASATGATSSTARPTSCP